ncbi:MAG: hypothetical protein ABSE08_02515 [Syntrophobacteraceae bacterium]
MFIGNTPVKHRRFPIRNSLRPKSDYPPRQANRGLRGGVDAIGAPRGPGVDTPAIAQKGPFPDENRLNQQTRGKATLDDLT